MSLRPLRFFDEKQRRTIVCGAPSWCRDGIARVSSQRTFSVTACLRRYNHLFRCFSAAASFFRLSLTSLLAVQAPLEVRRRPPYRSDVRLQPGEHY